MIQQTYNYAPLMRGLLDTVWLDPKREELDFRSKFALWLARIHVWEMDGWPLNTQEKIYDTDFPEWRNLNERQIVDELVGLGLRGGNSTS